MRQASIVACLPYAGETFSACGGWGVSDDKCLAGVSFSRWNQGRWQKGVQQRLQTTESFVASDVWKAHYGDLTQVVGHPDNNTVRRNCYKATPPLRQPRNPPVGVETTNVEIFLPSDRELGPRVGVW